MDVYSERERRGAAIVRYVCYTISAIVVGAVTLWAVLDDGQYLYEW